MKRDLKMNELSVEDLHLDYGTGAHANPILKGVSMHLQKGEVVALLGPSGSGKTTLLRAVAGLESPRLGSIDIGDRRVFDGSKGFEMPAEQRNLGLVFQSYALWPHKTVAENVAYGLKLRKMNKEEIGRRVTEVLKQLGLGHLGERFPHQLSGGQQQRVAIARSLAMQPKVMLFDEVTSALDPKLTGEVLRVMEDLARGGMTMIVVTHEMGFAKRAANRVIYMHTGKVWETGGADILSNPQTLELKEFMAAEL